MPDRLQCLRAHITALKLDDETAIWLLGELRQRPGWVRNREFKILHGEEPDEMILNGTIPKPSNEDLVIFAKPGAVYEDLTENEKRTARRRWRGIWTKPLALQTGQQEHIYTPLVQQFIDSIEQATGRRITITRDSSKIGGPRFNVLYAALELALFGSVTARDFGRKKHDFPARETVNNVIKRRGKAKESISPAPAPAPCALFEDTA